MTDWNRIKLDYVSDAMATYRGLADKYGVSLRQIARIAKDENWPQARTDYVNEVATKTKEKAIDVAVDGITQCLQVAQKLLRRIAQRVDDDTREISSSEYRQISGAIKDIKEIMTDGESRDNTIEIVMGEAEEFIR